MECRAVEAGTKCHEGAAYLIRQCRVCPLRAHCKAHAFHLYPYQCNLGACVDCDMVCWLMFTQGADLDEVMSVVGSDSRIGPGYLKACPGMGSLPPPRMCTTLTVAIVGARQGTIGAG